MILGDRDRKGEVTRRKGRNKEKRGGGGGDRLDQVQKEKNEGSRCCSLE